MISRWRDAFRTPGLPFVYVEMDSSKQDFWLGQRNATSLPNVGFATTADLQRALHPGDKQDIAVRLAWEVMRLSYNDSVRAKPEVLRVLPGATHTEVTVTFSDA